MAWTLQINKGGTTTAIANSSNYLTTDYEPLAPQWTVDQILDAVRAGTDGELTVTETISLGIKGANKAAVETNISYLNKAMVDAALYAKRRHGVPVYLEIQKDGSSVLKRSQILEGRLEYDPRWARTWTGNVVEAKLYIARRYFWENASKVALPINSVTNSTPTTTGVTIQNHYVPSTAGNFVTAAAAVVIGELPAPPEIEMQNTRGTTIIYGNIYIGCETIPSGSSTYLCLMKQGEDKQGGSTGNILTSQVGESNTSVLEVEVPAGFANPRWAFTAAQIRAGSGKRFRVLTRISWYNTIGGNIIFVEPRLNELTGNHNLNPYQGEVSLNQPTQIELNDVGTIAIGDYPASAGLALILAIRSAAEVTLEIDYIQLMPAHNFRWLVYQGVGVPNNERIVDDGIEGRVYQRNASSEQIPRVVSPKTKPIMLYPNENNRIYFLHDEGAGSTVADTSMITMHYRPRWLTP